MKLRTGFVSNSSSSSFLIGEVRDPLLMKAMEAVDGRGDIPIREIAKQMLKASDRKDHIQWLDKIPENTKFICFQSCNYETEIMDVGGCTTILTCNNESSEWDEAFEVIETRYNVTRKYIEETDTWEDLVRGSPYYSYSDYTFSELDETFEVNLHYSLEKIAKEYGPAVYISEKGAMQIGRAHV